MNKKAVAVSLALTTMAFAVGRAEADTSIDRQPDHSEFSERGLRNVKLAEVDHRKVVAGENAAFFRNQKDSGAAACGIAHAEAAKITYIQSRYGIPLVLSELDCNTLRYSSTRWISQLDPVPFWQTAEYPFGIELRLGVEDRFTTDTTSKDFEHSAAFQYSVRAQGPFGLGAYITSNILIDESRSFRDGNEYDFYGVKDGIREYALQLASHPFRGAIGVATGGRTYVNKIQYDFANVEAAYFWGRGSGRTKVTLGKYEPSQDNSLDYPSREVAVASQMQWVRSWNTAFEVGGGKFFYGDYGVYASANRFIGDFSVGVVFQVDDKDQLAGLSLSLPLTPRLGLHRGPLSIVGAPRLKQDFLTATSRASRLNPIRPPMQTLPEPIYNLSVDWLDSDRLYPAYIDDSERE
ncbi:hypothetical protein [Hydrocarboniphaga effusa]|uniref:hypothetical protein n=1 Tax=Hydrocarboniphaga effusa TaxID=243629 RepID=UPI0012FB9ADD|nr:hypothetical protein [Hydrocarboniphaga effusa]